MYQFENVNAFTSSNLGTGSLTGIETMLVLLSCLVTGVTTGFTLRGLRTCFPTGILGTGFNFEISLTGIVSKSEERQLLVRG